MTNLQICTSVGLIERVVNRLPNETDIVAGKVANAGCRLNHATCFGVLS